MGEAQGLRLLRVSRLRSARVAMWTALAAGALALALLAAALVVGGWESLAFGIPAVLATFAAVGFAALALAFGAFGKRALPRWGTAILAVGLAGFGALVLALGVAEASGARVGYVVVGGVSLGLAGLAPRAWRRAREAAP